MKNPTENLPVVVGISGATGSIMGFRLLGELLKLETPVELIISTHSYQVILEEMQLSVPTSGESQERVVLEYLSLDPQKYGSLLRCHNNKNIGAAPASGTYLTRGMVIIPCSMGTVGKLAAGISDNLLCRAADVTLKERRTLIVVPRESPFNRIHLENMLRLDQAGALILPPVLSFYQEAFNSVDGQINYTLGKTLDHLGLTHHGLFPRWASLSDSVESSESSRV